MSRRSNDRLESVLRIVRERGHITAREAAEIYNCLGSDAMVRIRLLKGVRVEVVGTAPGRKAGYKVKQYKVSRKD